MHRRARRRWQRAANISASNGNQFLIKTCDPADPGEEPDPDTSPGAAALAAGSGVLMARSNWHVHSLGRGGGVRWNVTFGRVQQLSLPALRALVDDVDMPFPHARENSVVLHLLCEPYLGLLF